MTNEGKIKYFLETMNMNLILLKVEQKNYGNDKRENYVMFNISLIDSTWIDCAVICPSAELIEFITKTFFKIFGDYPTFNNTSTIFWGEIK